MKTLLLLMTAIAIQAGPFIYVDGGRTDENDPRIGQSVYVVPLTNWMVYANDNPPPTYGDFDHNDGWGYVSFFADGSGVAKWIGSNSALTNHFTIMGQVLSEAVPEIQLPVSQVGSVLDLQFNTGSGATYAFGHRNIMTEQVAGEVPEPTTFGLVGLALCGISWRKWKRRKY